MRLRSIASSMFGAALFVTWAFNVPLAQQAAPPLHKVTPLLKSPVSTDLSMEAFIARVDWPPNISIGLHTHPGDEYVTVLEGSLLSRVEGGEWKTYQAGQSFHNPPGVVHEARSGDQPVRTINVFFVEKGKPVSQPKK